jgi:hypothetical protein
VDGNILIIGGCNCATAELFEPATDKFVATASMTVVPTDGMTATRLQDGRVLIAGGEDSAQTPLASAQLYDPTSGTFNLTGSMTTARSGQTATLLPNGKVLIAGGDADAGATSGKALSSAELYDPDTGMFSLTGSMITDRDSASAILLADGRVLTTGGASSCALGKPLAASDIYDPNTGMFVAGGSLLIARGGYPSVVLLDDGRVLVLGGSSSCSQEEPLASAELYDVETGRFAATGSMAIARDSQSAVRLADGQVLVVGGADHSAEVYQPQTRSFIRTGSSVVDLDGASATLLPDGQVLLAGGGMDASGAALPAAELYQP